MPPKFEFHEFVRTDEAITVIIKCHNGSPGEITEIGPGHQLFDLARRILDGRLAEVGWINESGSPVGCDLDIRTMLGTKTIGDKLEYFFALSCIWYPKGTMKGGSKFENIKNATEMEPDAEFKDIDPKPDDTIGRHSIDDLLNGLDT